MLACRDHVSRTHKSTKSVIIPAWVSPWCPLSLLCVWRASEERPDGCHPSTSLSHNANLLFSSSVRIPPPSRLLLFCLCLSTSAHPSPPSPLLLLFFIPPVPAPLSSALFVVTFHAVYLSADSPPRPGTGPQFPRQLYNCFGYVPSATGYRGIIDVKRNMYEARRCGGLHMVPYAAPREAI